MLLLKGSRRDVWQFCSWYCVRIKVKSGLLFFLSPRRVKVFIVLVACNIVNINSTLVCWRLTFLRVLFFMVDAESYTFPEHHSCYLHLHPSGQMSPEGEHIFTLHHITHRSSNPPPPRGGGGAIAQQSLLTPGYWAETCPSQS